MQEDPCRRNRENTSGPLSRTPTRCGQKRHRCVKTGLQAILIFGFTSITGQFAAYLYFKGTKKAQKSRTEIQFSTRSALPTRNQWTPLLLCSIYSQILISIFPPMAKLFHHPRKNQQRSTIPLYSLCEGLTLETSAFQIFYGSNSTNINSFDKTQFLIWFSYASIDRYYKSRSVMFYW